MTSGEPAPPDAVARRFGGRLGFGGWLLVLCLAGLTLRIVYVVWLRFPEVPFGGDSLYYRVVGNLLGDGRGFNVPTSLTNFSHVRPDASHPPLYTMWLAIVPLLRGGTASGDKIDLIWSCVLGTASIAMCGLAGREIAGKRIGLLAAALAVVYPNLWVHDGMLLSESMAIFTSAGVLLFAYRFWNRPSLWRAAWLGFWCGLATMARSELLLLAVVLVVPLVFMVRGGKVRDRLTWLGAAALAVVVVIGPWIGYNRARFKDPVLLSTNLSGTVSAANCDTTYYGDLIGFKDYSCGTAYIIQAERKNPKYVSFDQSQQDAAIRKEVEHYVRAHAGRVPVVVAARVGRIVDVYRPFQEVTADQLLYRQRRWVGFSLVYSFYIVAALAVAGAVVLRRRRVLIWPLLAVPIVVVIAVAVTFAQFRYRAPAEPALVLLAAAALDAIARSVSSRRVHATVVPDAPPQRTDAPVAT